MISLVLSWADNGGELWFLHIKWGARPVWYCCCVHEKKPSIFTKVKSIQEVNWNTFLWKKRWGWILNCCSDLPKVQLKIMGCGAFGVYCLHLCKHFVGFYRRPKSIVQVQPVVDRHRRKPTKYKYRKGNQSHQLSARKINTIYENNDDGLQWW